MGSFDIYCSLCCGTLYEVEIGGKSKEQRQVRQRLIAKKIQELQAQSERSGLAMAGEQLGNENAAQYTQSENVLVSEEEDEDSWEIQREMDGNRGYDPDIVSEESTKWLRVVHVLGYNPTAMGLSKTRLNFRQAMYSVTHPATPGFEEILRKLVEEKAFKGTSTSSLSLAHKVKRDPFGELPFDLLYSILSFLPGDSTRALMSASWPVYRTTRHPALWKQLMYWGMPWFWELHKLVEEDNVPDLDYKNLYLWLNKATMPVYGMRGPFLGIANRRRIWCACAQLAEKYFLSFHQRRDTTDEDFNSVLQQNQIFQLPMVKYPQPDMEVRTISKQWLHTLEEFNGRSALLETFWSSDDYLMGLTVSFRTSRRPFGRDAATGGAHQHVLSIESSDWISGLVLYMPVMDLLDAHACTAVKGIEDGIISRFGILESPATESDKFSIHDARIVPESERPFGQRLLWSSAASPFEPRGDQRRFIWSHPDIQVLSPSSTGDMGHGVPTDLVPHQFLMWALHGDELRKLTRISAYVKKDITSSGPMECLLGLRTEYIRRYWEPKRYMGEFPNDDDEDEDQEAPDGEIRHFDIDGPNSDSCSWHTRFPVAIHTVSPLTANLHEKAF
ncbi:F-box domain-containing protein [Histoplasma capsulatum G186AR]|uniref:F-box domain-containing protein n=1 Tax=Ajellomyces capsulatus (strain G186AR / H82 / ATCC MYA-2454 / RMSCC 2432) TaxID=447093 RepID=C0NYI8_AJECG|nr:F-box domain-containing protein [Histoplasma capsulatum G186AR]EEH03544.1 F-box domain-containing protein [Histoplasma capsulatum G186AR]